MTRPWAHRSACLLLAFAIAFARAGDAHADQHGEALPGAAGILFTWDAEGRLPIAGSFPEDSLADSAQTLRRWAGISETAGSKGSLVLDCGNTLFPGALSRYSYGRVMLEILAGAGVAAKRVTGGDFLLGREVLEDLARKSRTAFLAGNLLDSAGNAVFPGSKRLRLAGRDIEVYALLDGEEPGAWFIRAAGLTVADPESALRRMLAGISPQDSTLRICLLSSALAEHHPGILSVPGIKIFAAGMTSDSHQEISAKLRSGAEIVYVPAFPSGFGRLGFSAGSPLSSGQASLPFPYAWDSLTTGSPAALTSFSEMDRRWSRMYAETNGGVIREMDAPLATGQAEAAGNLLRERSGAEVACFDREIVGTRILPKKIRAEDLDRWVTASPDVYMVMVTGAELKNVVADAHAICAGARGGKVAGKSIGDEEKFSLALSEDLLRAHLPAAVDAKSHPQARLWPESLVEAIRLQLETRKRNSWDFPELESRWRLAGEWTVDGSRREVLVGNRDSVTTVPTAVSEPYSAWDVSMRAPFSIYNRTSSFDFDPEAEYARANGQVGENFLGLRLDYSYGSKPVLRPYGSLGYESYLGLVADEIRPARLRSSVGAKATKGEWTFSLGAAVEKTVSSRDPDPFGPLFSLAAEDSVPWDRGAELVINGTSDLGEIFHRRWPDRLPGAGLDLDLAWNNFIGASETGGRWESRLRLELSTNIFSALDLKFGWRALYAYLFSHGASIYNFEPSLSFSAGYHFKLAL